MGSISKAMARAVEAAGGGVVLMVVSCYMHSLQLAGGVALQLRSPGCCE
jgi:hypothetical protein